MVGQAAQPKIESQAWLLSQKFRHARNQCRRQANNIVLASAQLEQLIKTYDYCFEEVPLGDWSSIGSRCQQACQDLVLFLCCAQSVDVGEKPEGRSYLFGQLRLLTNLCHEVSHLDRLQTTYRASINDALFLLTSDIV